MMSKHPDRLAGGPWLTKLGRRTSSHQYHMNSYLLVKVDSTLEIMGHVREKEPRHLLKKSSSHHAGMTHEDDVWANQMQANSQHHQLAEAQPHVSWSEMSRWCF